MQHVSAYEYAEHESAPAFSTVVLKSAQIPVSSKVLGEVMGLGKAQIFTPLENPANPAAAAITSELVAG